MFVDTYEYIAGTMYIVKMVDMIIPPTTAVPIAIRPLQPSPVAYIKGIRPSTVDALVIRMGRRRCTDASRIATSYSMPFFWRWLANSTIRIPFLATSPTSMIIPIWLNMFMVCP